MVVPDQEDFAGFGDVLERCGGHGGEQACGFGGGPGVAAVGGIRAELGALVGAGEHHEARARCRL